MDPSQQRRAARGNVFIGGASPAVFPARAPVRSTRVADRDDGTRWTVMTDPEGNEFCVVQR
ncbi:VOC family protein [Georgenia sp. AZ-5]|uniref:VOC family protein n=1 Tax=Georgenia sp. AZ-5 TaxID=3367526 RepID=UPI0037548B18